MTNKKRHSTSRESVEARKEAFLQAYREAGCNAARACNAIGVEWSTFYRWLQNDTEFRARKEEVEHEHREQLAAAALEAAQWFLRGEVLRYADGREYFVKPDARMVIHILDRFGKYVGIDAAQPVANTELTAFLEFLNERPNEKLQQFDGDGE
jgi:hypothetical protein